MSEYVEEFKLDCCADLGSALHVHSITHKYDRCEDTQLDDHGLSQRILSTVELREEISITQVVDVELL